MAAISMVVYVGVVGVPGAAITWLCLFVAWPGHRRPLCWLASAGFACVWFLPQSVFGFFPLFLALSMLAAVIEQSLAAQSGQQRERASAV